MDLIDNRKTECIIRQEIFCCENKEKVSQNLEKSLETVLLGSSGKLESINLVNLLVAIEENIEETFGIPISITDERAVSEKNSPFRTVETLCNFMLNLLDEKQNG